jgi:hypothetical protein
LLDASGDGDPNVGGGAEEGGDEDVVERARDKVEYPLGVSSFRDDGFDPIMIDWVKSFSCVEEEKEASELAFDAGEEEVVDVCGVGGTVAAPEETLLGWVKEVHSGGHDGVGNDGGQNAVVSISDADGAGVGHKVCGFFREEKKMGEVEVGRGGGAGEKKRKGVEEHGAGDVGNGPPGGKGDAIWAGGGVFGVGYGGEDVVEGGAADEGEVDLLVIGVEDGRVGGVGRGGPCMPDIAPVVCGSLGHGFGVGEDIGVGGGLEAFEVLMVARESAFDVRDGVRAFGRVIGGGGEGMIGGEEAVVGPAVGGEGDEGAKKGVEGEEPGNAGKVLTEG